MTPEQSAGFAALGRSLGAVPEQYRGLMPLAAPIALQHRLSYKPTKLSAPEEAGFQSWIRATPWWRDFTTRHGGEPVLDDPNYDYRGAYAERNAGTMYGPNSGEIHFSSRAPSGKWLKGPDHPTAWKEYMGELVGVNPDEPSPLPPLGFERLGRAR